MSAHGRAEVDGALARGPAARPGARGEHDGVGAADRRGEVVDRRGLEVERPAARAPAASTSAAWSGLRISADGLVAALGQEARQAARDCPCPPAITTLMRRQPPELLAQPAVERRPRQLGQVGRLAQEARRDAPPPAQLPDGPPVERRRRRRRCDAVAGSRARRSGATTSARAVSECGAMNDTTKPSTPQAMTGPPLARL